MPYRDRVQVERWVQEFWDTHDLFTEQLSVLDKEFEPSENSGLVVAALRHTPATTYLSVKVTAGHPQWLVTFEPRAEDLHLDCHGLRELANDFAALSALCAFLQDRTEAVLISAAR